MGERTNVEQVNRAEKSPEESLWSAVSRESNFLHECATNGITNSIHDIEQNPGKAVMAAATGVAISAPLLALSWRYRALRPLLDAAGALGMLSFASDTCSKLQNIGSGAVDYWNHPDHKNEAQSKVSGNMGSLFMDSVATYGGLWAGSRFGKTLSEPLGALDEYYATKADRLRSRFFPKKPEQDSIEVLDFDENNTRWAERARRAEESGYAGIEKSMEVLMKGMHETSKQENDLVVSFLAKSKELVPGVQLRYVQRTSESGMSALRIGVKLPQGVSMLGDEAFTLDSLAGKLSDAHKFRLCADMTPVAGPGNLLKVKNIALEDLADDALVTISKEKKWFRLPFEFGKGNK